MMSFQDENKRPATSAASEGEGVSDAIAFMTKAALMLDRGEMPVPGCQYAANWSAAPATVLAALASPPVSERERDLAVLLDNLVIAQSLSRELQTVATDQARSYLYSYRHPTAQPAGEGK